MLTGRGAMHVGKTETVLLIFICSLKTLSFGRVRKTLFMDDEADCDKYVRSNDMIQGDMYVVSSDPYRGGSEWARRPAECYRNFNLGDRLIGVRITEFWCNEGIKDPFLAIYSNCFGRREGLLGWYNCTSQDKMVFDVPSTCLLIYHYRGHTRVGYYFSLNIEAKEAIMAFPAGGSAAIFFISVVLVLVVMKILCVITGYENRVPSVQINALVEEQKQILIQEESGDERWASSDDGRRSRGDCEHHHPPSPLVSTLKRPTQSPAAGPSGIQPSTHYTHKIVTISHSTGGASTASDNASVEYDSSDYHSPHKKHYVSSRMSRTFRL